MSGSQTFPSLTKKTIEEHHQIHFYLDQLERGLETVDPAAADAEPMRRLAARMGSLRERLEEHFETEDAGGLLRAVAEMVPAARGEVSSLLEQHGQLLEMLEMARIRAQWGEPSEAPLLRDDLAKFLAAIRDHERREEELLSRALRRELR